MVMELVNILHSKILRYENMGKQAFAYIDDSIINWNNPIEINFQEHSTNSAILILDVFYIYLHICVREKI